MGPDDVRRGVDGGWSVVVGELVVVLLPDCLKKVLGLCQASHQVVTCKKENFTTLHLSVDYLVWDLNIGCGTVDGEVTHTPDDPGLNPIIA